MSLLLGLPLVHYLFYGELYHVGVFRVFNAYMVLFRYPESVLLFLRDNTVYANIQTHTKRKPPEELSHKFDFFDLMYWICSLISPFSDKNVVLGYCIFIKEERGKRYQKESYKIAYC